MLWVDKFSSSLVRKKLEAKDQDISSSLWLRPKTEQRKQKTKQPSQHDKISAANISQQTTETCHVDHLQRFLCINLTRARHRVVTEKVDIYVVVVIQHRNINTALKSWKKNKTFQQVAVFYMVKVWLFCVLSWVSVFRPHVETIRFHFYTNRCLSGFCTYHVHILQ